MCERNKKSAREWERERACVCERETEREILVTGQAQQNIIKYSREVSKSCCSDLLVTSTSDLVSAAVLPVSIIFMAASITLATKFDSTRSNRTRLEERLSSDVIM